MARNVYAGKDSVAKIPIKNKVDTSKEIIAVSYALAYDLINLEMLDRNGNLIPADARLINGRFGVLYALASRFSKSRKIKEIIHKLHNLALSRLSGMDRYTYLNSIRSVVYGYLTPNEIYIIEQKVDNVNDKLHSPFWRNFRRVFW